MTHRMPIRTPSRLHLTNLRTEKRDVYKIGNTARETTAPKRNNTPALTPDAGSRRAHHIDELVREAAPVQDAEPTRPPKLFRPLEEKNDDRHIAHDGHGKGGHEHAAEVLESMRLLQQRTLLVLHCIFRDQQQATLPFKDMQRDATAAPNTAERDMIRRRRGGPGHSKSEPPVGRKFKYDKAFAY